MNINTGGKKKAAIYVRVSTTNQIDRDSLKTQEERLRAYCIANNYNVHKLYRDAGLSAKDTNRPALEELMRNVKSGLVDVVVVTKLDRITRSISDLINLVDFFKRHEIQFVSITENIDSGTAYGRFMRHLLGLLAQLEREVTAERVATDMRHRAMQGKWNGGVVPYGYMTQGLVEKQFETEGMGKGSALVEAAKVCPEPKKLYINPNEAKVIEWIYDTFIKANSIPKTTHEINENGTKTRRGALWASSSIHRILSNPTYAGKVWYGKRKTDPENGKLVRQDRDTWTVVAGEHEAIISGDRFEKAQKMLVNNYRKPTRKGRNYLLTGILKCALCGGAMTGYTFTRKGNGKSYSYYKCVNYLQKGKTACEGQSIPVDPLEGFIVDTLKKMSHNQSFLSDKQKMLEILKGKLNFKGFERQLKQIERDVEGLQCRLDVLLEKLETGIIDDDDFKARYQKIKYDIQAKEDEKDRLRELSGSSQVSIDILNASFEEISNFGSNWEFLDGVGRAMRIKSIVKEIRATKANVDLDIFLDLKDVSHTDMDSWRQQA